MLLIVEIHHDGGLSLAAAAESSLQDSECELTGIWTTHHHWDHAGGNETLCGRFAGLHVIAPQDSHHIPCTTNFAKHGDALHMHPSLPAVGTVLHAGVHTAGHAMYLLQPPDGAVHAHGVSASSALFAGDVLFPAGAGRFFESDALDFWKMLKSCLLPLPGDCLLFTGHDYSVGNGAFAAAAGLAAAPWAGRQSLPPSASCLGVEAAQNPFLLPMAQPVLEAVAKRSRSARNSGDATELEGALETLQGGAYSVTHGAPREVWQAWQMHIAGMDEQEQDAATCVLAYLREWKNAFQG